MQNTLAIAASEEELLFINEPNDENLAGEESTWVVDSSVSFHLTPNRECFSSYRTNDYDYMKMGMMVHARLSTSERGMFADIYKL